MPQNTSSTNRTDSTSDSLGETLVDTIGTYMTSDGYEKAWGDFSEAEKRRECLHVAMELFGAIGVGQVPAMSHLLNEIKVNPRHPLVRRTADAALQPWEGPYYWADFVDILERINRDLRNLTLELLTSLLRERDAQKPKVQPA